MALSAKAESILYRAKWDAIEILEKMDGLLWDASGEYYQNADAVKAVVKPLLSPYESSVKLSYSKDNNLSAAVFNVSYEVSTVLVERAAVKAREAKRKELETKQRFVRSLNISVADGFVTALVGYTFPGTDEDDVDMYAELVDRSSPNGVAEAQCKILNTIIQKISK